MLASQPISWRRAIPWNSHLPHSIHPPQHKHLQLLEVARTTSALYVGSRILVDRAQRGITQLHKGTSTGDTTLLSQAIEALAGLGPGLTPAGDDFLVGWFAARWAFYGPDAKGLNTELAALAAKRTTQLSGQWLIEAGSGNFGMPWHRLIKSLEQDNSDGINGAVQTILRSGATSGADALCGFVSGLQV